MKSYNNKIVNAFIWLNWILSFVLLDLFIAMAILTLKGDSDLMNKIYAMSIMFCLSLLPAIIFLVNGLLLRSGFSESSVGSHASNSEKQAKASVKNEEKIIS